MLTDSERLWLNHRDIAHPRGTYFCEHCDAFVECQLNWPIECPTELSIKPEDIAFETRVAVKLTELADWIAQGIGTDMECIDLCYASDICGNAEEMSCKWCFLKWARLQVEEEMNDDKLDG